MLYFGVTNCNYIVFPSGLLVQNFGYHGQALMDDIRKIGVAAAEHRIRDQRETVRKFMARLRQRDLRPVDVNMTEGSPIGEFDFGLFKGHASRKAARPAHWDAATQSMLPARPAHWSVFIDGTDGAWCEVTLPLKNGRALRRAIVTACSLFDDPGSITPDKHGRYGNTIELKE